MTLDIKPLLDQYIRYNARGNMPAANDTMVHIVEALAGAINGEPAIAQDKRESFDTIPFGQFIRNEDVSVAPKPEVAPTPPNTPLGASVEPVHGAQTVPGGGVAGQVENPLVQARETTAGVILPDPWPPRPVTPPVTPDVPSEPEPTPDVPTPAEPVDPPMPADKPVLVDTPPPFPTPFMGEAVEVESALDDTVPIKRKVGRPRKYPLTTEPAPTEVDAGS